MNCHQILSGACNAGDRCFAIGSVEGIPFTVRTKRTANTNTITIIPIAKFFFLFFVSFSLLSRIYHIVQPKPTHTHAHTYRSSLHDSHICICIDDLCRCTYIWTYIYVYNLYCRYFRYWRVQQLCTYVCTHFPTHTVGILQIPIGDIVFLLALGEFLMFLFTNSRTLAYVYMYACLCVWAHINKCDAWAVTVARRPPVCRYVVN